MDAVIIVVGVFLLIQGQMKVNKNSNPWPSTKRKGRIIGLVLIFSVVIMDVLLFIY